MIAPRTNTSVAIAATVKVQLLGELCTLAIVPRTAYVVGTSIGGAGSLKDVSDPPRFAITTPSRRNSMES